MSPEYQEYYQELLAAFRSHEDDHTAQMEVIEACFKSSLDYWGRIAKLVRTKGFGGEKDEILFFKEVKPAFAAFIEYYTYRYHALLFAPVNNPTELGRFWRWEEKRMQRFYETHREFCSYMREGATHRDAEYFLRVSLPPDTQRTSGDLIHDGDSGLLSPKDPLVTIMKAYELYGLHIETIVASLNPF